MLPHSDGMPARFAVTGTHGPATGGTVVAVVDVAPTVVGDVVVRAVVAGASVPGTVGSADGLGGSEDRSSDDPPPPPHPVTPTTPAATTTRASRTRLR
jgi:hypothetical protein